MAIFKLALALGLSTWLWLPGTAAAAAPSEEQSEAQPLDISPEELVEGMLGLIERYGQHAENGSGDEDPWYSDEPWRPAPPLEDGGPDDPWRHAPPLEDEDAPSEDDDSWHSDEPWRYAPPLEDDIDVDRPVLI